MKLHYESLEDLKQYSTAGNQGTKEQSMTKWNNRVIKDEHGQFNIHEVYYGEDGNIESWTIDPTSPCGDESLEDLIADLKQYSTALEKPVLVEVDEKLVEL